MKRLLFASLLLLTTALIAVSCGKDDPEEVSVQLSVNYTQGDIPAEGGTATFTITCNADWTISNPNTWLTLDKTSGNGDATITVTVAANTGAARQGTLSVKAGDKTGTATIKQLKGADEEVTLTVSYTPNDVPATGGTETFTITCNADWTVSNTNSWLTLDKTSGDGNATVSVTVAANTGDARQGTLTVSAGAGAKTEPVVINQLAAVSGDLNTLFDFAVNGGAFATYENLVSYVSSTFTLIDKDGDGNNWRALYFTDEGGTPTGEYLIMSESYRNGVGPFTPENYLVLPAVTITSNGKIEAVLHSDETTDYYKEKFKIVVSSSPITSANCQSADVLFTHTLTQGNGALYTAKIDVPAQYNGSPAYFAICHFGTDQFYLAFDSITIAHTGPAPAPGATPAWSPAPADIYGTSEMYQYLKRIN